MTGFIEGVGDEVLWLLLFIFLFGLISLAWLSTGIPPVDYYVWFVPRQTRPSRRIVQISQVDSDRTVALERSRAYGRTQRALESLMDDDFPNIASARSHLLQDSTDASNSETDTVSQSENNSGNDIAYQVGANETAEVFGSNNTGAFLSSAVIQNRLECGQEHDADASSSSQPAVVNSNDRCQSQKNASHSLADIVADSTNRFQSLEQDNLKQNHSVKLKFLDDSQFVVNTTFDCTVGQFKRRFFWDSILSGKIVRLIFRGQLLRDDSRSLSSYGLHDECVVHCHISSTPYAQPRTQNEATQQSTSMSIHPGIETVGTAAAAIAAIAGTPFLPLSAANQVTRSIAQTYRGQPIEDNRSDPLLLRGRNAVLRYSRAVYNVIMGPVPETRNSVDNLLEASAAATQGWNQGQNAVGIRIGRYLHLILIVKFVALWIFVFLFPQYTDRFSLLLLTFVSLFFATVLFSTRQNDNTVPTRIRTQ